MLRLIFYLSNLISIAAHFQHGSVQPIGAEQMDCFRAKEDGHKLVVAAVADNVYTGTISQGLAAGLVRNFIAIRNKVTNKVSNLQQFNFANL